MKATADAAVDARLEIQQNSVHVQCESVLFQLPMASQTDQPTTTDSETQTFFNGDAMDTLIPLLASCMHNEHIPSGQVPAPNITNVTSSIPSASGTLATAEAEAVRIASQIAETQTELNGLLAEQDGIDQPVLAHARPPTATPMPLQQRRKKGSKHGH